MSAVTRRRFKTDLLYLLYCPTFKDPALTLSSMSGSDSLGWNTYTAGRGKIFFFKIHTDFGTNSATQLLEHRAQRSKSRYPTKLTLDFRPHIETLKPCQPTLEPKTPFVRIFTLRISGLPCEAELATETQVSLIEFGRMHTE